MTPPTVNIQKGTKSAPNTNPDPKSRPGLYYSELSDRWYKTEELLGKERRDAEEAEKLVGEASQPTTTSGTMISAAQAAEIRVQVRQAIQERFAKARAPMGEILKEHKMHQDVPSFGAKLGTANPSPSVIDLVASSTSSAQVVEFGVLLASPI